MRATATRSRIYALRGFSGHLDPPATDRTITEYVATTDPKDPVLSPIYSDLHGLPPTLFVTSGRDLLLSGTVNLHRAYLTPESTPAWSSSTLCPTPSGMTRGFPKSIEANHLMADFFVKQLGK